MCPSWSAGPGSPDASSGGAISLCDLTPTICAHAGASTAGMDGIDVRPLLTNGTRVRNGAYIRPPGTVAWDAIRTPTHKWAEHTNGARELYDLGTDPYELQNVAADPTKASVIATLRTSSQRYAHDPRTRLGVAAAAMGDGDSGTHRGQRARWWRGRPVRGPDAAPGRKGLVEDPPGVRLGRLSPAGLACSTGPWSSRSGSTRLSAMKRGGLFGGS